MTIRPSVPEIITVNSESLQTQIRDLLPSQSGFGSELQATNVITPIIDLTSAAEGSTLPSSLQTALAFGSSTSIVVANSTVDQVSSPGFYQFVGNIVIAGTGTQFGEFQIIDSSPTTRVVYGAVLPSGASGTLVAPFNIVIWLKAGEKVTIQASATAYVYGSFRQVANSEGTLSLPNGYPL
jgi:hypothetical protein